MSYRIGERWLNTQIWAAEDPEISLRNDDWLWSQPPIVNVKEGYSGATQVKSTESCCTNVSKAVFSESLGVWLIDVLIWIVFYVKT